MTDRDMDAVPGRGGASGAGGASDVDELGGEGGELPRPARIGWLVLPLLIAVVVGVARWPESDPVPIDPIDPIDLAASGPRFATVEELSASSDVIVVGTVEAAEPGRMIGDPTDPDAGILTTLYRIAIEETLVGSRSEVLVVEHETALADGRPITINGATAPAVGDRALLFLIAGTTDDFPHHAIVNEQGRYLIDGDRLRPVTDDPLTARLGARSLDEITLALGGAR